MDFKRQVFSLIAQFTGQNNVITINVTFVEFTGDLETGLFLSQMIYWADRTTRKDGFFYKTDEEWQKEIMLSKYAVRKSRKKLEEMGLLETVVKKANGNPTVHYRFNKTRFSEMFISFLRNRKNEIANSKEPNSENEISLTDITTDIYTDKNTTTTTTENPVVYFEQMLCRLSPRQSDSLYQWVDDFDGQSEIILEAIDIADNRNKRTFGFVEFLLREWANNNLNSLDRVRVYEQEKFNKQKSIRQGSNKKQSLFEQGEESKKRQAAIKPLSPEEEEQMRRWEEELPF